MSYFYLIASSEMHTIAIVIPRKRQGFLGICLKCSKFYMLDGKVIKKKKYSAVAFIKGVPFS